MGFRSPPIGAILAGGAGRRIGGDKAIVELHGKPLICYPLEALRQALADVAIVAKADTKLPFLSEVTIWIEPEVPRHPLAGITQALALADGRAVLVCASDLPFVTPALIRRIAHARPGRAPAVIACAGARTEPLIGCYQPRALQLLVREASAPSGSLRETIAAIDPVLVEVDDHDELFNVKSPDDLLLAAAMLDRQRRTSPTRR